MNYLLTICLAFTYYVYLADAVIGQCKGKNSGESCIRDEDCYALNAVCRSGKCNCGLNFDDVDAFKNSSIPRKCKPASAYVGHRCGSNCRPPLICNKKKGECMCKKGSGAKYNKAKGTCDYKCGRGKELRSYRCEAARNLDESCGGNGQCKVPFSECQGGRCRCISGSRKSGNKCIPQCPDGSPATQTCRRLLETRGNLLDKLDKSDNCPKGSQCFSFGNPPVGLCCPIFCPYGRPDKRKSCEDIAIGSRDECNKKTHYCYKIQGPGHLNTLCCPRPCQEPHPLYIDGRCLPLAYLEDICEASAQCDGGVNMRCSGNRCVCRSGFIKDDRPLKFPSCRKRCNGNAIPVGDDCLQKVGVGDKCISDRQCPGVFYCKDSKCTCPCGYTVVKGDCVREEWAKILPKSIDDVPKFIENAFP